MRNTAGLPPIPVLKKRCHNCRWLPCQHRQGNTVPAMADWASKLDTFLQFNDAEDISLSPPRPVQIVRPPRAHSLQHGNHAFSKGSQGTDPGGRACGSDGGKPAARPPACGSKWRGLNATALFQKTNQDLFLKYIYASYICHRPHNHFFRQVLFR